MKTLHLFNIRINYLLIMTKNSQLLESNNRPPKFNSGKPQLQGEVKSTQGERVIPNLRPLLREDQSPSKAWQQSICQRRLKKSSAYVTLALTFWGDKSDQQFQIRNKYFWGTYTSTLYTICSDLIRWLLPAFAPAWKKLQSGTDKRCGETGRKKSVADRYAIKLYRWWVKGP